MLSWEILLLSKRLELTQCLETHLYARFSGRYRSPDWTQRVDVMRTSVRSGLDNIDAPYVHMQCSFFRD